jgi:hypothetical protein
MLDGKSRLELCVVGSLLAVMGLKVPDPRGRRGKGVWPMGRGESCKGVVERSWSSL